MSNSSLNKDKAVQHSNKTSVVVWKWSLDSLQTDSALDAFQKKYSEEHLAQWKEKKIHGELDKIMTLRSNLKNK
jgi:hypothetical protein